MYTLQEALAASDYNFNWQLHSWNWERKCQDTYTFYLQLAGSFSTNCVKLWMLIQIPIQNTQDLLAEVGWGFSVGLVCFLSKTWFSSRFLILSQLEKPVLSFMFHFNMRLKNSVWVEQSSLHFICHPYV